MPIGKYKRSEEHLKKLRARLKEHPPMFGKHHSDETKKKQSKSQIGKQISTETRAKMRSAHLGQKAWNKGMPMSEEQKEKLSKAGKGKQFSEETRRKLSLAKIGNKNRLGHPLSEEEKAGIAEDIKEIYTEAKGAGFDVKIIRKIVNLRKMDAERRREEDELLELYKADEVS